MKLLHQTTVVLFLITLAPITADSDNADKELETFKKDNSIVVAKDDEPCETACERKKMYCNFHDYASLSQEAINKLIVDTLLATKELRLTNSSKCNNEATTKTILSTNKFSNQTAQSPLPFYSENNTCVYGYIRSKRSWSLPCDASGKNFRTLCTCRNQGLEFEKSNKLVIVNKINQTCDKTCMDENFKCSFEDYSKLSRYETRHLLKNAALTPALWNGQGSCSAEAGKMFANSTNHPNQFESYPPFIYPQDGCVIYGYVRNVSTPMPNCSLNGVIKKQNLWLFCSCEINKLTSATLVTSTNTRTTMINSLSAELTSATLVGSTNTRTTMINPLSAENSKSDGDESSKGKDEAKDDKSLHKLAIAAIVIFVLGLCLIILGVALFLINRAKKNKETGGQKSTQHDAAPKSVISATTKGKSGVDEVSRTAGKSVQMTRSSNQRKSVKKTLGLTSKTSAPKSLK